jgi:hypothetical protein
MDNEIDIKKTNLEISLIKNQRVFLFYIITWRD